MSLHSEMMSVTFKAKTKKCKPSLGPGLKTVWRRLPSSNKNADANTVSGQSRHQTTHQSLTCSMTAQQCKNNVPKTVLTRLCWLWANKCLYWWNINQNIMTGETRHQTTNEWFTHSKIPQQREKNVPKIISLALLSWLWAGKLLLGNKQLIVL